MKKSTLILIGFLFSILVVLSIFSTSTFAKYVLEENIIVGTINIDRTLPNVDVSYSPKEKTTEKVEVTLKANEPIQEPGNGWVLQDDGCTLKKQFEKNTKEEVEVKDKSGNVKKVTVEVTNIDTEAPTVQIQSISNSNTAYPNYANKETQIKVNILVQDDQKIQKSLEEKDIQIFINNTKINPSNKTMQIIRNTEEQQEIELTISGIEEEGKLSFAIEKGIVQDEAKNSSQAVTKNTEIQIDNTKPQATYSQEKLEDGKIEAKITANEAIRKLEGWNIERNTILKKIFRNILSYTTTIQDLAGNSTSVKVDVARADDLVFCYASYNSTVGWSYAYGNDDVVGLEAVRKNPNYKSESVAFGIMGDVEKDYLQGRGYVYSYWKEGSKAKCGYTGKIYSYGWNPNATDWKYIDKENKVTLDNERDFFQFGGAYMNRAGTTDIDGNNPIPTQLANKYTYGVSAIQLKLKSYEEHSICYQIYVDSVGWLAPAKNGEITCYDITKPISALRAALVPNSEVNAVLNTWSQYERKIHSVV